MAGLLVALFHYFSSYARQGTLFVGAYWAGFYAVTYQDGFRRRALLGTICRLISPSGVSVLAINMMAFATLAALLLLVARSYLKLEPNSSTHFMLFSFALFASPTVGISIDVLGDTLQIALLLFCVGMFILTRYTQKRSLPLLGGLALIALAFFIHEASVFFLAPALPFFLSPTPRLRSFILPSLLLAGMLVLSGKWSHLNPTPSYPILSFPHERPLVGLVSTPDFKTLLAIEQHKYLSSPKSASVLLAKLSRPFALGFVTLSALAISLGRSTFDRMLFVFAVIFLYCVPLWVVAHDWGRFVCYCFFLAVIATAFSLHRFPGEDHISVPVWVSSRATNLRTLSDNALIQAGVLFALLDKPEFDMQTKGLGSRDVVALGVIVTIALVAARSSSKDGSGKVSVSP
jgi:hypothetical protein